MAVLVKEATPRRAVTSVDGYLATDMNSYQTYKEKQRQEFTETLFPTVNHSSETVGPPMVQEQPSTANVILQLLDTRRDLVAKSRLPRNYNGLFSLATLEQDYYGSRVGIDYIRNLLVYSIPAGGKVRDKEVLDGIRFMLKQQEAKSKEDKKPIGEVLS